LAGDPHASDRIVRSLTFIDQDELVTQIDNVRTPTARDEEQALKPQDTFRTTDVISLSVGHWIHDTYTAFLAPMLPALIEKFLLTKTEAGLLSVFMQGPSIFQPLIGHMADRVSLRYLVILAPAVTATMMSLLGVAPAYILLPFLLMVAGLSSACIHAVGPVMAGRVSGKRLGLGMGSWMVGGELGRTVGPILLVSAIGYLTLEGLAWLMLGGWAASAILYFRLKNVPGRPDEVSDLHWKKALRDMRSLMLPLALFLFFRAFINVSLTTYLPIFLKEEGSDLFLAGAALSILEGAGVVGAILGGTLSDRWGRRSVLYITALATPPLAIMFLAWTDWVRFALLVPLGLVTLASGPVMMAMVQESYPDNRALANGVFMALGFTIRAVVVVILGMIGDTFGLRSGFILSAGIMLLAAPVVSRFPGRNKSAGSAIVK
jgi:FSR family fosmidomycin resistance protein-like MFS transporter